MAHEDEAAPDGEAVVAEHWPYDGPHSPERLATALEAIAELVRYSNNASQHQHNLGFAPQVWRTLDGMSAAAGGLPQLFSQFAAWTEELSRDSTVRHDAWRAEPAMSHQVAEETAAEAATALRQAGVLARQLQEAVSAARQPLSHLYHEQQ